MEIFQDLGNVPLIIIRFNPDSYIEIDKKIRSPFGLQKNILKIINKKEYNRRLTQLISTIQSNITTIPIKEINMITLFYNKYE